MDAEFRNRIGFISELARRLHEYGTTALRLEAAIGSVSRILGVNCQVWSSPTAIILSFAQPDEINEITRVIRLNPGDINLRRLSQLDEIAERVTTGQIDVAEGWQALREIRDEPGIASAGIVLLAFGLCSACVAMLLKTSWPDVAASGLIGLMIGLITLVSASRPRMAQSSEAVSALLSTFVAAMISAWLLPLNQQLVAISGLIVLLPGLGLTSAITELSTGHLVSGTARLAGAISVLRAMSPSPAYQPQRS